MSCGVRAFEPHDTRAKVDISDFRCTERVGQTLARHGYQAQTLRQRPAVVSHTGSSAGQQCVWSSQQVALGSGQQAHVKQYPKKSRRQQHVAPANSATHFRVTC